MHTLGKVLAVLVALLALGAVFLTTKALATRVSWMKTIEGKRKTYEDTIQPLQNAREQLSEKKHQLAVATKLWEPEISTNMRVDPRPDGQVILNDTGASALKADQIVHVFSPNGAQGMVYVGPFKVIQVNPGRGTVAQAAWPMRPAELATWPQPFSFGAGCHVYGNVPVAAPEVVFKYAQLMLRKDELLMATQNLRDLRQKEITIADEHKRFRLNELEGDAALEGDRGVLPQYMIDGLVAAIEDADESRNSTAREVDELRHVIKTTYDDILRLRARNEELIRSLPQERPATYESSEPAVVN